MSAEARADVEALKADAARTSTDGSNLVESNPVLWRWISGWRNSWYGIVQAQMD